MSNCGHIPIHVDEKPKTKTKKTKKQSIEWGLGSSLAIATLCPHSSSHMASDKTPRYLSKTRRRLRWPRLREWLLENPTSGNRAMYNSTQAREHSLVCEKISTVKTPLTFSRPTPQSSCLLCGARLRERPTKPRKNNRNTYLNETVGKACKRFLLKLNPNSLGIPSDIHRLKKKLQFKL